MRSCKLFCALGLLLGSAVWLQGCKPPESKPAGDSTAMPATGAPAAGDKQPEPTTEPLGSG